MLLAAAEQGLASAQFKLGGLYAEEQGWKHAVRWWHAAAAQGDQGAEYNLGVSYDQGAGVPQDSAVAVSLFRRAAQKGYADAQNSMGAQCTKGEG